MRSCESLFEITLRANAEGVDRITECGHIYCCGCLVGWFEGQLPRRLQEPDQDEGQIVEVPPEIDARSQRSVTPELPMQTPPPPPFPRPMTTAMILAMEQDHLTPLAARLLSSIRTTPELWQLPQGAPIPHPMEQDPDLLVRAPTPSSQVTQVQLPTTDVEQELAEFLQEEVKLDCPGCRTRVICAPKPVYMVNYVIGAVEGARGLMEDYEVGGGGVAMEGVVNGIGGEVGEGGEDDEERKEEKERAKQEQKEKERREEREQEDMRDRLERIFTKLRADVDRHQRQWGSSVPSVRSESRPRSRNSEAPSAVGSTSNVNVGAGVVAPSDAVDEEMRGVEEGGDGNNRFREVEAIGRRRTFSL